MNYSITKDGEPLDKSLYTICEKTKTFSSNEDCLILDFSGGGGWVFNTRSKCTFNIGWNCTFITGSNCTFNTGDNCTFNTGDYCTFKTAGSCTFNTGDHCTFNTSWNGTFNTGGRCNFTTGTYCTFNTGYNCTFKTGYGCTVMSCLKEIKMILIEEPTEFKCNKTEFLFKVGDEYVAQSEYEMYEELIS